MTSLVERTSRFTLLLKNLNKRTKQIMDKVIRAIRDLPIAVRRSITFDRGTEFVFWPHLQAGIGTQTLINVARTIGANWLTVRSLRPLVERHRGEH